MAGLLIAGDQDPAALLLVATAGNLLGSVVNWVLGRYLSHFRNRRWFPVSERRYEQAADWFRRFGLWSLLFAWLPIVGDPLTVIAGALRVRFAWFLVLVGAGKAARYLLVAATALSFT